MASFDETGITNLGPVPEGMTFQEATAAMRSARKYQINPRNHSKRLTFCETMREIWRISDALPEPERSALLDLAAAGFDYGKRMDARMKELKGMIVDA